MKRCLSAGIVALLVPAVSASQSPSLDRLDELLAVLRAGDEARLEAYVTASFTEPMWKTRAGDPGILPFLKEIARRQRGFDVIRTIVPAPHAVTAVVRPAAQPSRISRLNLTVEAAPPHRIEGLFVLPATAEDLPDEIATLAPVEAMEAFRERVEHLVAEGFSGVVLLARGNEVVLERAAGEADRSHHVPNTAETVFGLASMNKMFTAVAIAKLAEQGKLSFSDPVGRHLRGWLPDDLAARVTVDRLLTHTSGLGDYLDRIETDPGLRSARSLSAYRNLVGESKPDTDFEGEFRYSNTGYVVLGALIEAVSGRAVGYIPPDESEAMGLGRGWRTNQRFEGTRGTSAGGGMSTARDLFRFARALVEGKLVKRETLSALVEPRVPFLPGSRYGYGFIVGDGPGPKRWGHSGGFSGVAGELRVYGDGEWTLVVLSNVSDGSGEVVAAWGDLVTRTVSP